MTKRIGHQLTCDKCDKTGATIYTDEGAALPKAEQKHLCTGTKRPTSRSLKCRA